MSAIGTRRTNSIAAVTSANDPKRTLYRYAKSRHCRHFVQPRLFLRQARLCEIKGAAVEDCRVSEGVSEPPRLQRDRRD